MRMRIGLGIGMLAASITIAACNVPFVGETDESTPIPTAEPADEQVQESEQAEQSEPEPTEAVEEIEAPSRTPIAHLEPGELILITNIQMQSQERGWGIGGLAGASDHVFRTNDGGTNWLDVTPPEPAPEAGAPAKAAIGYFLDTTTGWAAYYEDSLQPTPQRFRVWSTSDGGANWQPSRPIELEFLGTSDYPPMIGFEDARNGWMIARHGPAGMHSYPIYVLRTANGGESWEMALTPAEGGLQSCRKSGVDFGDRMTGWATVADCPIVAPELAVTNDGGRTWEPLVLPAPESRPELFETELCEGHSPQLISPMQGAVGVTCRTGLQLNYIYWTNDGGKTWQSHLYPGGTINLLNDRTAFALDRKIYQTLNGGATWDFVKSVQWDGQFSFVNDQVGWAVARQGDALALVTTTTGGKIWDLLKPIVAG